MSTNSLDRRRFILRAAAAGAAVATPKLRAEGGPVSAADRLKAGWLMPPRSYRPHTRWWWPGSAVTKDGISWQLEQMRRQGMGGVEIMSAWGWYEKGSIPYLSPEWLEMVRHAIREAAKRDLQVALTFGPGWSFGGFWVPPEERSKVLAPVWSDVEGPASFDAELPAYKPRGRRHNLPTPETLDWLPPDHNRAIAVVAAKRSGDRLEANSLTDLTSRLDGDRLRWSVPAGSWRIFAFRLVYTGQQNQAQNSARRNWVVDHINKNSMRHYCDYLAGAFSEALGDDLGETVDSFFCDSFEIFPLGDSLLWSTDTLDLFRDYNGYDLTPYLPAIWFDIGELTPKIRYDVNQFLSWLGLETAFRTFIDAAGERNVQARIQPHYRFTEEIISGAGITPRPETELTTARFETIADPRKSTAAGAHFYGRKIVSAEAYTFTHPERYRTTLQDMKIGTDAFLRDGVTQFYNHGYVYSPEMEVAPSRDVPWANRISHWNTWWKYYHHLTAYIGRAAYLLRQGRFTADVLLYSPQATVWTQRAIFGSDRRTMPYGNVPKTLLANGYDYEPVNDDVLQHHARVKDGHIKVRDMAYRFVILPKTTAIPVETLEFLREFVRGGGVIVALDELPASSVGLKDYGRRDAQVLGLVAELFGEDGKGREQPGGGRTYFLPEYKVVQPPLSPMEQPYRPTPPLDAAQRAMLDILRKHLPPDFAIEGDRQSDGLTFIHRKINELDVYFVTNLQPKPERTAVTFRVSGMTPERWDPYTAAVAPIHVFRVKPGGVEIPVRFEPWESTFVVFRPSKRQPRHVARTNLDEVTGITDKGVHGLVAANGGWWAEARGRGASARAELKVSDIPTPLPIEGTWKLSLEGVRFPRLDLTVDRLASWTEDERTKHFSGTGAYELDFDLPAAYLRPDLELVLDMGSVGNVAEVLLNGKEAGVRWIVPYRLEVTGLLRSGRNSLRILVTNTLINHVSGLPELPGVPAELAPHYGKTVHYYKQGTNSFERREKGYHPLPLSGLAGPVRLTARRRVILPL